MPVSPPAVQDTLPSTVLPVRDVTVTKSPEDEDPLFTEVTSVASFGLDCDKVPA